ncbi:MAG: glycoside hydrolase family 16 protein [Muribaculaceae bacterium]|nr:glycoside hydrolase family 16 protein [Muribaculaceae bacterium]
MKNKIFKATAIAAMLAASTAVWAVEPQVGSGETNGYKLVWQDLFDDEELNPLRWHVEKNGGGGGNNELQYYVDDSDNAIIGKDEKGNSCLILTAKREARWGKAFTSGRVNSKNMIAVKHGKVEAAIRLPKTANGLWPAFWMMGNDYDRVKWPKCGEIDIMEFGHSAGFNGRQESYFNGACHWGTSMPQPNYAKAHNHEYSLQDGEFHLYTLIWDEKTIEMYCDLDKYPTKAPYYKMGIEGERPGEANWCGNYFHKEFFILFNLAVGGNFPGIYDANRITALNDENGQKASMYINYVKIYQKGTPDESQYFVDPGDDLSAAGIEDVSVEDAPSISFGPSAASCSGAKAMEVIDLCGRCVGRGADSVALGALPAGAYIVRALLSDGRSITAKIAI